jgi:hypothetical protein
VHEIDPLTVDHRGELRDLVEFMFGGSPVVVVAPVLGEFAQPRHRHARVPAVAGKHWWPTCLVEVTMQPINLSLLNFNRNGSTSPWLLVITATLDTV